MKFSRSPYLQILSGWMIMLGLLMPIGVGAEQASLGPSIAEKARQAVQDAQENGVERKEVFFNKVRDKLQKLDSQLAVLKDKGDVLRAKTRSKLIVQLDKINLQKKDILPRLELATRSSEAAWQDVKKDIDQAVEKLKIAVDQATSNFF